MSTLLPYPQYGPSGAEWLGQIPTHWNVVQLGRIGTFSKGGGGTKDDEAPEGVPCVRYGDLYTRHRTFVEDTKACVSQERAADYAPIRYGDVLFAGSGETIEEIGKSAVNLLAGPACCGGDVIVFRPSVSVEARFLGLATDCPQAASQKSRMGRGITVMHIYGSELKHLRIALPPLPEQAAIVRYLDHVDRRGQRLVRAKRKLIALLAEQKQAVIHRAGTRGLDPDVTLKDAGVEWLGKVPERWEVRRMRDVVDMRVSNVDKHVRESEISVRLCNYVDVYKNDCINQKIDYMRATATPDEVERFRLVTGDVLITKDSETWNDIGVPALVTEPADDLISGYHLALLRPSNRLSGGYLLRALQSKGIACQFHVEAKGVTRYGLSHAAIKSIWLPLPAFSEQEAIVEYLDRATADIDTAISSAEREIGLLDEYRTRLIADVVTGKLDVREEAAALPEVDPLAAEASDEASDGENDADHADEDRETVVAKYATTASDGKTCQYREGELEESSTAEDSSVVRKEGRRRNQRSLRPRT